MTHHWFLNVCVCIICINIVHWVSAKQRTYFLRDCKSIHIPNKGEISRKMRIFGLTTRVGLNTNTDETVILTLKIHSDEGAQIGSYSYPSTPFPSQFRGLLFYPFILKPLEPISLFEELPLSIMKLKILELFELARVFETKFDLQIPFLRCCKLFQPFQNAS